MASAYTEKSNVVLTGKEPFTLDVTGAAKFSTAVGVAYGGTGATSLTGYVKGTGTSALSGSATIPAGDVVLGSAAGVPVITGSGGVLQAGVFGTTSGSFCQGNDGRLSDSRTPTSHVHGQISNAGAIGTTPGLPIITTTDGVLTTGVFGTTSGSFCQGNDSRLSDARTPTAHNHAFNEITGIASVSQGGTGTTTGSITGTGSLTFTAGGTNTNVTLAPNGTGTVDVSSKKITSLATPTQNTDAATKAYVDGAISGQNLGTIATQNANSVNIDGGGIDGTAIGADSASTGKFTQVDVDNVRIDANTVSTTNANGNLTLAPNGTGTVDVSSKRITSLATPTQDTDAATKAYVDSVAQGLDVKASVRAATTANITLSGAQTIDGVSVIAGERVLVKDQSTTSQNGIYVVGAGSWIRAADFDNWTEVPGAFVFVEQGTTHGDDGFVCTSDQGGTLGTTAVSFAQFSRAGLINDGVGLTKTGDTLDLDAATSAALGGIKLGSDTAQSTAANAVTSTASRTYALQVNASGQAVVNVPWVDTNTTYSNGTGLDLTGTVFSVLYGTGSTNACRGDDSRLSNARTPTSHVLATASGLGGEHTVSGLTSGQVLKAKSATTAQFEAVAFSEVSGTAAVSQGGTGATTASGARTNLQVPYTFGTGGTSIVAWQAGTNVASGDWSVVNGGRQNTASASASTVGGGRSNTSSGYYSTVGGGRSNTSGDYSAVGGGYFNASGIYGFVGGGRSNTSSGLGSTVGGGMRNTSSGYNNFVGGGRANTSSGSYSVVGGGFYNISSGGYSVVVGGGGYNVGNIATGKYGFVGGGKSNTASGKYASIAGGTSNTATHSNVFLLGSSLVSDAADTTYVENLRVKGGFNTGVTLGTNAFPTGKVSIRSAIVNLKTVAETTIFTVPTGHMFLIDTMEVVTTSITGAAAAPTVRFGNTVASNAYYGPTQMTSNSLGARHIVENPQDGVAAGTVVTFGVTVASTATAHSGVGIVTGYLLKTS